jgi:hypothetical protein
LLRCSIDLFGKTSPRVLVASSIGNIIKISHFSRQRLGHPLS